MHWSAVPPPVARRPRWRGLQFIAFTAAWCSENFAIGVEVDGDHINSLLSFPPEASWFSSCKLHLRPQTSCLWSVSFYVLSLWALKSRIKIVLSLLPEAIIEGMALFHARELTLPVCPPSYLTYFLELMSHICTFPLFVPILRWFPRFDQLSEVIASLASSSYPSSHSSYTVDVVAFHTYTEFSRATARIFCADQSTRLR